MKRMLAIFFGITMILATVGAATAAAERPEDAGPGDNNQKGHCTAYFNGQKKGHDKNGNPGPFQDLEDSGQEYDDNNGADDGDPDTNNDGEDLQGEQSIASDVFEYCQQYGIGGQPEHNGRYDCKEPGEDDGRDQDGDLEIECYENDGEKGTDTGEDGTEYEYDTGNDHPSDK